MYEFGNRDSENAWSEGLGVEAAFLGFEHSKVHLACFVRGLTF